MIKKIMDFYVEKLRTPVIFKIGKKKYRFDLFRSAYLNYEVKEILLKYIDIYFKLHNLPFAHKDHLYNHIFIHNEYFHKKACLIKFFNERHIQNIDKIYTTFLIKEDLLILKQFGIQIKKIKNKKLNSTFFLLFRVFILELRKYVKSRRVYKEKYSNVNHSKKYTKILSAWGDINVETFLHVIQDNLNDVLIYLKPNVKALQNNGWIFSFMSQLRKGKHEYFEFYPKNDFLKTFKRMIQIYFSSYPNQIKTNIFDVEIQREFFKNLVLYIKTVFPEVKEFYSNSVFHSFAVCLCEELKKNNIKTIDVSWLLDLGGPIQKYDVSYICSKTQEQYYCAPNTEFRYKNIDIADIADIQSEGKQPNKIALFFVHQCIFSDPVFEHSFTIKPLYYKVLEYIEKIGIDCNIPVFMKYHPRSKNVDKILLKNVIIVDDVEKLPKEYKYICLTYFSTYVIELLKKMPFYMINPQGKLNLKYLYPDDFDLYIESYEELKEKIKNHLNNNMLYEKYWESLIKKMIELKFFYLKLPNKLEMNKENIKNVLEVQK